MRKNVQISISIIKKKPGKVLYFKFSFKKRVNNNNLLGNIQMAKATSHSKWKKMIFLKNVDTLYFFRKNNHVVTYPTKLEPLTIQKNSP